MKPSDVVLKALKLSSNACKMAIDEAWRQIKGKEYNGVAQYRVVDTEFNVVRTTNTACIADLMCFGRKWATKTPLFVVYAVGCKSEVREAFLKWWTQESVFSKYFFDTDSYNYDTGFFVTACDIKSNTLAIMNNVLRCSEYENDALIDTWHDLVKKGVDKNLAFLLCNHRVDIEGDIISLKCDEWNYFDHSVLTHNDNKLFFRVISGIEDLKELDHTDPYMEWKKYGGVNKTFNRGVDKKFLLNEIRDLEGTTIKTEDKKNLLGEVKERGKEVTGHTAFQLNELYYRLIKLNS